MWMTIIFKGTYFDVFKCNIACIEYIQLIENFYLL